MNKYILVVISIIVFSANLFSQNSIDNVLIEIEKNNTMLSALRKTVDADKMANKTEIYLQNPEFEFNYLWGSPSVIGNRTNISFKQSFDFPSAYRFRNQISDYKNEQAELEYQKQKISLLLQSRQVCYDLVYVNSLMSELSERKIHAQSIASAYKSKLDVGDANILESNKAQLNLLNISKELESIEIEREALLAKLALLNGGEFTDFSDTEILAQDIPSDFEEWYLIAEENNPILNWLKQEIEIAEKEEKLSAALNFPKLSAGYASEKVVGQQYQGITVGFSIPLWENKNSVKYAKLNSIAIEGITNDNKLQFYNQLKALHAKAIGLRRNADDYRVKLISFDNLEFLEKALAAGEISLIDYILEFTIYYESINNLLELEMELNKTISELTQYM